MLYFILELNITLFVCLVFYILGLPEQCTSLAEFQFVNSVIDCDAYIPKHSRVILRIVLDELAVKTTEVNPWQTSIVDLLPLYSHFHGCSPFKVQWGHMVTFRSVQCHQSLTYIFNFWHSGTLALRAEYQSARTSEIKNAR